MSFSNDSSGFTLPPFAQELIHCGAVSLPQMQQALIEMRRSGRSLAVVLEEMVGRPLSEADRYDDHKATPPSSIDATIVNVTEIIEETPSFVAPPVHPADELNRSSEQDEAIVSLVNKILILGMREKASEIYLEPEETKLLVRIRQGGIVRSLLEPLPKKLINPAIKRLKEMVGLDTHQTSVPQKGKLRKSYNSRPVYFFIKTLPSFYGEKVVVRIVESLTELPTLSSLSIEESTQKALKRLNQRQSGLILITGPAFSGLSSTLEACLGEQHKQEKTITTIEDPIRRTFPGITQVEINLEQGLTYSQALQSLSQQVVDVILVEKIEDPETAQAVFAAVKQGHLVLAGLNAKDSCSAIAQLNQWVNPEEVAEYLSGVVNQRLLRRVCPTCRLVHQPEAGELKQLQLASHQQKSSTFYRANTLTQELIQQLQLKGRLCRQCNGVGYHGQIGIYEVLPLNASLKSLIRQGTTVDNLRQAAIDEGMKTLVNATLDKVLQGETTLEEFFRHFPDALTALTVVQTANENTLPKGFSERLNELERSLASVTKAFAELKQTVNGVPLTQQDAIAEEPTINKSLARPVDPDIDLSEVTLVGDSDLYEELGNLSDWPNWQKSVEPQPQKAAIASDDSEQPPAEDDSSDPHKTVINPFKSIMDPW